MNQIPEKIRLKPPEDRLTVETIDMHTGGEPLRIITGGIGRIDGETVLEKRRYFRDHLDHIRRGLMFEPRGHADMYGAVITPPCSEGADFGTFFLHNEGYSTMCGHAVIALTRLAVESGMVKKDPEVEKIVIDTPAGRIQAGAVLKNGVVEKVSFCNVPSFVYIKDKRVDVPEIGSIRFDVAYGGAFYVLCRAEDLGVSLDGSDYNRLISCGRKIKTAVSERFEIAHPFEPELGFLYGTIIIGDARDKRHHSRNVCIFARGEVDRSPTGSGVSARAALHYEQNELAVDREITIESILDTLMTVRVTKETRFGPFRAVIPEVSGSASYTGSHKFYFDPDDDLKTGFIFR
ncbi:MAG: proline racemase family protein [Desulfobacteraceae bacterium]